MAHPGQEIALCHVGAFCRQHGFLQRLTGTDLFGTVRKHSDKLRCIQIFHPVYSDLHPAFFLVGPGIFHQPFKWRNEPGRTNSLPKRPGILLFQTFVQILRIHNRNSQDSFQIKSAVINDSGVRLPDDERIVDAQ